MMDILFLLSNLITPANAIVAQVAEASTPIPIGYIVLGVIVAPVVFLTAVSILGKPRTFRIPALFLGAVILLVGGIILSFAALGVILKLIIPQ